ncbi:Isoleucine--tRNA ligase [Mycoplasmopsis columboralis]|uniref:Isoleucine--tRNA ligase n=1 Tax=Mycoplasmopsis columboralis TaxID=171282 RepID=A0A449B7F8_9BACT|nr:isoleucine--tRNA ligase [Mycoplasmopsis columboralis]VEU76522.1 Isoleucine--tRNA ligase [Mycoplasmopsis columboralis]
MIDYKKTLNMPQTDFEMRANLTTKEPKYRQMWLDKQVYKKLLVRNKNNKPFIVHDGPPYANGDLHLGHALNKILKDIVVRYKTMQGFYSPFIAGWDTHGLPIEHKMLAEANLSQKSLSVVELRKRAGEYALKQVQNQKQQFAQLSLLSDLEKIYVTMDKGYEAKQLMLFKKMVMNNLVYKGLKPVYWSPSSQSALAEAEVEYQDVVSPSIYVAFEIVSSDFAKLNKGDFVIIWTTTPWTLIANAGVALGENIEYLKVQVNQQNYVVASELLDKVAQALKWENYEVVESFLGKEVTKVEYKTPILDNIAPVVLGHHVTTESGTGLVHIAPLFGEDDFLIGKKHNLNMIMHIADDGTIEKTNTIFDGLFYEDANKKISEFLGDKMLAFARLKHSYPHDWRTHKPIIFRGTPQWFVSIEKIKEQILEQIDNHVISNSSWGKKRLMNMIENRHDWTISRQRSWGVPITIFYDANKNPVFEEELFDHVIALVEQYGSDVWFKWDTEELLPAKYQNKGFTREMDIMDVWFDSGVSSLAVDIDGFATPYDLYLEGTDQYRGWFNSSIINAVAWNGKTPYLNLVSHGFVVDAKGEKMSKSKGNTISPLQVVTESGADILRLWVANSEYSNDISISKDILKQNSEVYRKLRNTIRFLLANINGYKFNPNTKLSGIHLYINEQLKEVKNKVLQAYDEFKFISVIKLINNYVVELSAFYLSIIKDALYVKKANDEQRLMALHNLYLIAEFLIVALAPILPTTAEEAYSFLDKENKQESVFFEMFFNKEENVNVELLNTFNEFFTLKDQVNVLIEQAIQKQEVKRSNELKVTLPKNLPTFIKELDLKTLLQVGDVEFGDLLEVSKFDSLKCQRCWNHFYAQQMQNDLCHSCAEIVSEMGLTDEK